MRVLYGVVGEGMGHATRSRVVLEHLLAAGHEVRVVVSGRAHGMLLRAFDGRPNIRFDEIHGFHLNFDADGLSLARTIGTNLIEAPRGLLDNLEVYRRVVEDGFQPEVVVSDFESWAYFYARNHFLPVLSIDNMQVLNRCRHDPEVLGHGGFDFRVARAAVKAKLPGATHYLVTTFFFPPVRKPRTTLVPPILRPEILAARREPGRHVLVYQTAATANPDLVPILRSLPYEFRVYGLGGDGGEGNVTMKPFSEQGFVDDLRTARAVIANGGFSLMGEAVHLRVPMLSIPLAGQFEQEMNARYLAHLRYGMFSRTLDRDVAELFLQHTDTYATALEGYTPRDNGMLFACLDELIDGVQAGETKIDRVKSPALGKWQGPPVEDEEDFTRF